MPRMRKVRILPYQIGYGELQPLLKSQLREMGFIDPRYVDLRSWGSSDLSGETPKTRFFETLRLWDFEPDQPAYPQKTGICIMGTWLFHKASNTQWGRLILHSHSARAHWDWVSWQVAGIAILLKLRLGIRPSIILILTVNTTGLMRENVPPTRVYKGKELETAWNTHKSARK